MAKVELNTPAPDFTLADYEGNDVSLSQFAGKQNVLLVFNRGFVWPFCQAHMAQLRQDYDEFVARTTAVVVLGPEQADTFKRYFTDNDLPFIGLPDPDHSVLKLYGQEVKLFKFGRMPAQVLVDKAGVARFVHYGHSMQDIPDNQDVLATIDEMN